MAAHVRAGFIAACQSYKASNLREQRRWSERLWQHKFRPSLSDASHRDTVNSCGHVERLDIAVYRQLVEGPLRTGARIFRASESADS
jgi:hypothetical protein